MAHTRVLKNQEHPRSTGLWLDEQALPDLFVGKLSREVMNHGFPNRCSIRREGEWPGQLMSQAHLANNKSRFVVPPRKSRLISDSSIFTSIFKIVIPLLVLFARQIATLHTLLSLSHNLVVVQLANCPPALRGERACSVCAGSVLVRWRSYGTTCLDLTCWPNS